MFDLEVLKFCIIERHLCKTSCRKTFQLLAQKCDQEPESIRPQWLVSVREAGLFDFWPICYEDFECMNGHHDWILPLAALHHLNFLSVVLQNANFSVDELVISMLVPMLEGNLSSHWNSMHNCLNQHCKYLHPYFKGQ